MASVDGYTKAGADAAFAPIGHTHPGGGGASYGGVQSFVATEFAYLNHAGQGTQIAPTAWLENSSMDAEGTYLDPGVLNFVTKDVADNDRLYFATAGLYVLRTRWHIRFPNSSPTIVSHTLRTKQLDADMIRYDVVAPGRPETYLYEGNYRNVLHSNGDVVTPPIPALVDDWACDPYLWWNTNDILVDGGTTVPGDPDSPIPSLWVSFHKIA